MKFASYLALIGAASAIHLSKDAAQKAGVKAALATPTEKAVSLSSVSEMKSITFS